MPRFFVPGNPVPQGRARAYRHGDGIGHYDDPKSKAWKHVVAQIAALQYNRWVDGPLSVNLVFHFKRAKSCKDDYHTKRPDCDNLAKAVLDSLNGICYKDDSQVVDLRVVKMYGADSGVYITIGRKLDEKNY